MNFLVDHPWVTFSGILEYGYQIFTNDAKNKPLSDYLSEDSWKFYKSGFFTILELLIIRDRIDIQLTLEEIYANYP